MKTEKIIGIVELDEYGEFRDLLYEETNRIAQEKARKIDCEITKKIRQEAISEFREGLLEKLRDDELGISSQSIEVKLAARDIMTVIQSYNLPIKE